MRKSSIAAFAIILASVCISSASLAKPFSTISGGNIANGKARYATCMACHGTDGTGQKALGAPSLQNQHDWYLKKQIKNFKAGIRGAHARDVSGMQCRAILGATLTTEQEIDDVVTYIGTLN